MRFQAPQPVTGSIGPGSYDIKDIHEKPISKLGVAITTACRFPEKISDWPSAGDYQTTTFIDLLEKKAMTLAPKATALKVVQSHSSKLPGPGTYNPNYAVGRHVGNDHRFALTKSEWLKEQDVVNKSQIKLMKQLLHSSETFWEKRTGRRIAHLALYF